MIDFDEVIDRSGRGSLKWDKYKGKDILPLWVADMDFRCMPEVNEKLAEEVQYGLHDYRKPTPDLSQTVCDMLDRLYGWKVEKEAVVWLPGVVTALNICCRAYCTPEESVMTATPMRNSFQSFVLDIIRPRKKECSQAQHHLYWERGYPLTFVMKMVEQ